MVPATKNTGKRKARKRVIRSVPARPPHWLGWIVIGGIIVAIIAGTAGLYRTHLRKFDDKQQTSASARLSGKCVSYPGRTIDYKRQFNDINDKHISAATKYGLRKPLKDAKEAESMRSTLTKIRSNKNYKVDDLSHSLPYLTKGAARTLDVIAADFSDILERNGLPHYRCIVTSVLRTEESVQQLRKSGNINASNKSAHCYGTTFDISYKRFDKADPSPDYMNDENLKLVLGQALLNAQRKGLVYVKYEYKQACFHVTARQ